MIIQPHDVTCWSVTRSRQYVKDVTFLHKPGEGNIPAAYNCSKGVVCENNQALSFVDAVAKPGQPGVIRLSTGRQASDEEERPEGLIDQYLFRFADRFKRYA